MLIPLLFALNFNGFGCHHFFWVSTISELLDECKFRDCGNSYLDQIKNNIMPSKTKEGKLPELILDSHESSHFNKGPS